MKIFCKKCDSGSFWISYLGKNVGKSCEVYGRVLKIKLHIFSDDDGDDDDNDNDDGNDNFTAAGADNASDDVRFWW